MAGTCRAAVERGLSCRRPWPDRSDYTDDWDGRLINRPHVFELRSVGYAHSLRGPTESIGRRSTATTSFKTSALCGSKKRLISDSSSMGVPQTRERSRDFQKARIVSSARNDWRRAGSRSTRRKARLTDQSICSTLNVAKRSAFPSSIEPRVARNASRQSFECSTWLRVRKFR